MYFRLQEAQRLNKLRNPLTHGGDNQNVTYSNLLEYAFLIRQDGEWLDDSFMNLAACVFKFKFTVVNYYPVVGKTSSLFTATYPADLPEAGAYSKVRMSNILIETVLKMLGKFGKTKETPKIKPCVCRKFSSCGTTDITSPCREWSTS